MQATAETEKQQGQQPDDQGMKLWCAVRRPGALVAELGEHAPDLTIGSLDELLRWLGSGADGHHGGTEARS